MPGLAGIEVTYIRDTARNWRCLNLEFGVGASTGWCGEIFHGGRQRPVSPDIALCAVPGEIVTTPVVRKRGDFNLVMFEPTVFVDYVVEHDVRAATGWPENATTMSSSLKERLMALVRLPACARTAMESQSRVVSFFERAVPELIRCSAPQPTLGRQAARRIREYLHSQEGVSVDLQTLALKLGMSRYQVLRTFRAQYGLSPLAYQLCAKVAAARRLLKEGHSLTRVAADCGFADQSHFGRHFKKLTGVTPGDYANIWRERTGNAQHRRRQIAQNLGPLAMTDS